MPQAEAAWAAGALLVVDEVELELVDFSDVEVEFELDDESALTLDLSPVRLSVR
jgi:hypothetical protein